MLGGAWGTVDTARPWPAGACPRGPSKGGGYDSSPAGPSLIRELAGRGRAETRETILMAR